MIEIHLFRNPQGQCAVSPWTAAGLKQIRHSLDTTRATSALVVKGDGSFIGGWRKIIDVDDLPFGHDAPEWVFGFCGYAWDRGQNPLPILRRIL
jgi:hypothetical protein